uniref:DNA-directed DNA polymerase n=1 Tax=Globodera pallida TaxID=36090 RepID=A0A183BUV9_GLOPA
MKVNPFPVGNPRVLTREVLLQPPTLPLPWTAPTEFRGLLLVRVLPPRDIRIPLLGYRTQDGRFTFPLCATCADRRQQRPCRHSPEKRSWVTAYTHVELNKALELGYVVTDLFEVWHYDEWDDTLFSSYVNTFVGLKVQASGWPDGCVTVEQRQAYLDDFWQTEGIRLDPAKIAPNPGLRLIAKTLANSLWGKLAQRVGHTEIRYTRTPAEFHRLLEDPTLDKLDFVHVSPHMDRCVVRKRPEFAKAPPTNFGYSDNNAEPLEGGVRLSEPPLLWQTPPGVPPPGVPPPPPPGGGVPPPPGGGEPPPLLRFAQARGDLPEQRQTPPPRRRGERELDPTQPGHSTWFL